MTASIGAATPLTKLPGVGPKTAEKLSAIGLNCCADLLFHLPLRFEDRTRVIPLPTLRAGDRGLVVGQIVATRVTGRARNILAATLSDGQSRLTLRFFRFFPNQLKAFNRSPTLLCYGEIKQGFDGPLEMIHPEYRIIASPQDATLDESLTPVYPATDGVGQTLLRRLTDIALDHVEVVELLPEQLRQTTGPGEFTLAEALRYVHRPPPDADQWTLLEGSHPAQQRLIFEELLAHRLAMRRLRMAQRERRAIALENSELPDRLERLLPFALTSAQQRVTGEIEADLKSVRPMLRLVHGDVGSGKTIVAALAACHCIGSGQQCALVAPTEILAEQHLNSFAAWLKPLGIEPVWLTGKVKGKARTAALAAIADGAPLVVGTHAVFEPTVQFARLALAIVDEQHRFGVRQRLALRDKGADGNVPHQLIMTATPIPRTLAMTAYADLDVSVIDELPPGRTPVATVAVSDGRRAQVIERVAAACQDGRQVYWVCTLIEESEVLAAQAATDTAERLASELEGLRVDLIHGRLKADEKEQLMARFKSGQIDVLVATTVIEVGVDVPNASLMIIENAERLGLSQLHQLRGRVGRGTAQSSCVLLYQPPLGETARERLSVMRQTNDGFEIARKDLKLRGAGEVLGTRQTGMMQFRIADLDRDRPMLEKVSAVAHEISRRHPDLIDPLVERWVGQAQRFGGV